MPLPDFELRVAIINIKAKALSLSIQSDTAQIIASVFTDTRAIEGFLRKLMNETAIKRIPISSELVSSMLKDKLPEGESFVSQGSTKRITPLDVLDAVSQYFDIKPMHLKGPKRDRPITRPRQLIMYICKQELNVTLDDIGGVLGGRDHTTVLHGVEKIKQELTKDAQLQKALLGIKEQLFT